jgi:hypothetical protein
MALRYVFDEHLRGPLWRAVQWHNTSGVYRLDVVRIGNPADLPLGIDDPTILVWAESAGRHSPGVFMIRPLSTLPELVTFLRDAAYASEPAEWRDRIQFIP